MKTEFQLPLTKKSFSRSTAKQPKKRDSWIFLNRPFFFTTTNKFQHRSFVSTRNQYSFARGKPKHEHNLVWSPREEDANAQIGPRNKKSFTRLSDNKSSFNFLMWKGLHQMDDPVHWPTNLWPLEFCGFFPYEHEKDRPSPVTDWQIDRHSELILVLVTRGYATPATPKKKREDQKQK